MCPSERTVKYVTWTCVVCKVTFEEEVNSDGLVPKRPREFRTSARIKLNNDGLDWQGAAVGPGYRLEGDCCDGCFAALTDFVAVLAKRAAESNAATKS